MNDEMGRVYDCETAAHFIATRTGLAADAVERWMRARDEYAVGMGIQDADTFDDMTPETIRALAPEFFRPAHMKMRLVMPAYELAFIVLRTGLDVHDAEAMQDADEAYMRKLGLIGEPQMRNAAEV
jgi:hypothetical protein